MPGMMVAGIAVENTAFHFDTVFSYRIPPDLVSAARPGCRVLVPFGASKAQKRQGMILSVSEQDESQNVRHLKSIAQVIDASPVLNEEGIRLVYFLKERTFCTLYEAVRAILPSGIGRRIVVSYSTVSSSALPEENALTQQEESVLAYLRSKSGFVQEDKLCAAAGVSASVVRALCARGCLLRNDDTVQKSADLTKRFAQLSEPFLQDPESFGVRTAKQKSVIELLNEVGAASLKEICYYTGVSSAVLTGLEKKGVLTVYSAPVLRDPYADAAAQAHPDEIVLSSAQSAAFDGLLRLYETHTPQASLLYGVTGSGKTKVYMKLIDRVLADGRQVILMVPEIALTPQALRLFHERYGRLVAVFHSGLSVGERLDAWKRVRSGDAQIVVGTRSAVFAPFDNIGLILLDEEQESAYKSENSPRYHARDVAKFRCNAHNALLLLASATPSVESFAAAKKKRYALFSLPERFGDALLPEVVTVDMVAEKKAGNRSEISGTLQKALEQTLSDGRQAILLINRRGYQTFAACTACGHVVTCPSCSISMTYHRANERLMCHYCGYSEPLPAVCPACAEPAIQYTGVGTQRIEDELSRLFPQASVLRMDTDTTMTRFAHEDKLRRFAQKEYSILLGTQMVAKGLDFENVTLAGVISVDSLLYNDDYRALERTFSLLTQVVGRSGRGSYRGKAVIQTTVPENDVIEMASRQDYEEFYRTEIDIRRMLIYPPYCDLCVVAFASSDELLARGAAKAFLEQLRACADSPAFSEEKLIVLGPAPARVLKVNDRYRYRLIVKCKNTTRFRAMMSLLLKNFGQDKRFAKVTLFADINPESIL